ADACRAAVPALEEAVPGHAVRCLRWRELTPLTLVADGLGEQSADAAPTLLEVVGLEARYRGGRSSRPAVHDVSFSIARGRCVALVGESGSGKTTVGRCIAGLHAPAGGRIVFDGVELRGEARSRPLDVRRRIQIVFQNP